MTTRPLTLPIEAPADAEEVFYPETDGMPLPDGPEQAPLYREIVAILERRFSGPRTLVNGNTFIYYVEGDASSRFAPDGFVTFDVDKTSVDLRDNYLLWEVGKAPDFALEIGSHSTGSNDIGPKRELYAELGIGEYWRYDPTGGDFYGEALVGERLVDGEYVRFDTQQEPDGSIWGHSPTLNLDLHWTEDRLRFYDPEVGGWLENLLEVTDRADREAARADQAEAERDFQSELVARESAARREAEDRAQAESARAEAEAAARARVEAELEEMRRRLQSLDDDGR